MIKETSDAGPQDSLLNSRDGGVVTVFGHEFRGGVDVIELHLAGVGAEKEPLLTLRKGDRGKSAVLLRVSVRPDGAELGVDEFSV